MDLADVKLGELARLPDQVAQVVEEGLLLLACLIINNRVTDVKKLQSARLATHEQVCHELGQSFEGQSIAANAQTFNLLFMQIGAQYACRLIVKLTLGKTQILHPIAGSILAKRRGQYLNRCSR